MRWCDENTNVIEWASEEIVIPYNHPIHNRRAKYYPDFWIKFKDGSQKLVEVKPKKETTAPEKPKRRTQRYLNEMMTWATNCEKWDAAMRLCNANDIKFEVWTEEYLKAMGILNWETDKAVLRKESSRKRSKMRPINKPKRPRPKRKS